MNKHKNTLPSPDPRLAQLEQRVYQLETCYKVTSLLNSELNLSNLLDTIMNVAKKVMNADACSFTAGGRGDGRAGVSNRPERCG